MNSIQIKTERKKLGITQKKLAEMLGVSTQTVNGYENGKEIPETKIPLLIKIFDIEKSNIVNEPTEIYITKGYDKKILSVKEQIKLREEIIDLANGDQSIIQHEKEMIKLLKTKIEMIETAKKNHLDDL
jgi:transcriptional regulator with XRE-family HTH domain